jgi:hypothetical protein
VESPDARISKICELQECIEDYEREKAEKKLLIKLQEAEVAVKDENA